MTGVIADLQRFSLHDGPGVRSTVFLKGCNLHCPWCHNPETWSPLPEEMFFEDKCMRCGHCAEGCPVGARVTCGSVYSSDDLYAQVIRDKPFWGPDGGVTVSGGEALLQANFVGELFRLCARDGVGTCLDTALCVPADRWSFLIPLTGSWLVDVKSLRREKSLNVLGADPALLAANLRLLHDAGGKIRIRVPCVVDFNDGPEDADALAKLLSGLSDVQAVDILPVFHHGERKEKALRRKVDGKWFSDQADEVATRFAALLREKTIVPVHTMLESKQC